ncbi:hypothetical protein B0T24DRAFT_36009 [Lasiosphaeria ovina]|uniref:NTF2-like protein n=1 Tax=Lasiosphaeria ovina TaxID=92902 RepID=A0AAE0TXH9_9PEZI|nr:hypothetical protein B0T24DRAFT_36009 [Lasiosphaeria ovina]
MSLQAAYKRFLAAPSSSALASNASLHYITTTASFSGATEIIKHVSSSQKQIKKKKENVLFAIEDTHAVAVEVDTTLEFVSGGGAYLPGLDDNFVADRTVYLIVTHIVTFDGQGNISQIRQSWDQASLLKQLDIIGKTGRNWPIRDSTEQISLITRCIKTNGVNAVAAPAQASAPAPQEPITRSRGNSAHILRDPHTTLGLGPRDDDNDLPTVVSPYAGTRPHQRSFADVMGTGPNNEPESPSRGRQRSDSPSKAIAPKIGAGKNYQSARLFHADEEAPVEKPQEEQPSPDRLIRPNPRKYQHFDFADGSDPQDAPKTGVDFAELPKTKDTKNWSFDDFVTPQKPTNTRTMHQGRNVRHWGPESDVVEESPERKATQVQGRRDAEAHFELIDDGEATEPRLIGRPRGAGRNAGLGLYEGNKLTIEDGSVPTPGPPPLGNITNLGGRHKDFDPHFNMTDESPTGGDDKAEDGPKIGDDRKKAVRMMESNWSNYDVSPASQKENNNPTNVRRTGDDRGISIAGDGMGGKKGNGRYWAVGDEEDEGLGPRNVPGKQQQHKPTTSTLWDF